MSERRSFRPGLALDSSGFQSEADAYLQSRVAVFYALCGSVAVLLYFTGILMLQNIAEYQRSLVFSPERIVHFAAAIAIWVIWWQLKKRRFSARTLLFLDALGLYIAIGTCLMIYAIIYRYGPVTMPAFIALFVIARAVVVPCDTKVTVLLSLPALVGMVAIQLWYGKAWFAEGLTGVWTHGRKIASIGIHVKHWVTWHGFALNVSTNLSYFDLIVPCGIDGVQMTSITNELRERAPRDLWSRALDGVILGFSEVFQFQPQAVTLDELLALS